MEQPTKPHYSIADPVRSDHEDTVTSVAPQLDSAMLGSVSDGKLSDISEIRKFQSVVRSAIEDVMRRARSQPNTSLELCWTDKLAELKANFSQNEYDRLLQFMKYSRSHENLMDGHSWRLDPTSYPYSALRVVPSKHTFRLLILMPAAEKNSPIKCTLAQDLIETGSKYEALSYVWGAVPGKSEIEVNNRPFLVTKNLEAALRTFRLLKKRRTLWVDAICINQNDPLEKSTQVQMMGEIYSKATNVLIWLGNETNAALKAFRLLEWILTMLHPQHARSSAEPKGHRTATDMDLKDISPDNDTLLHIFRLMSSMPIDNDLECVATIMRNPYWSRIWVLQEVVLARSATVFCGSLSMEWNEFTSCVVMAWEFCEIKKSTTGPDGSIPVSPTRMERLSIRTWLKDPTVNLPFQAADDIHTNQVQSLIPPSLPINMVQMKFLQKRRLQGYSLSFPALIAAALAYKSTNVRDQVYGLLGMADVSEFDTPIIADYTNSYAKVCTQLAVKLLLKRMDLAVLEDLDDSGIGTTRQVFHGHICLPLWARDRQIEFPHLSLDSPNWKFDENAAKREASDGHIHLPSWVPDWKKEFAHVSLDLENWKFDENVAMREVSPFKHSSDAQRPRAFNASAHSDSQFPYKFSSDLKIFTLSGIDFDTVKRVCFLYPDKSSESRRTCLRHWQGLVKPMLYDEYPRGGTYKEAYWRTTFCNIYWQKSDPSSENRFSELPSVILDNVHIPPTFEEEEERLISLVCTSEARNTSQMAYRTLFLTSSGLLGLGPISMRPGDKLAVLMGGRVPLVLRQTSDYFQHDKTKSGTYYRVVGESYVHGVMQGEVVKEQEAGAFKLEEFQLV